MLFRSPGGRFDQLNEDTQDGYAMFGDVTISLTKTIDLTVGLRHHNQSGANQPLTIVNGVTGARPILPNLGWEGNFLLGSKVGNPETPYSYSKNTGKVSLQKQFRDNIMGYIAYSEGFNSGGASRFTNPADGSALLSAWKPQTLENTEIGFRSDLANKKLRLNATVFHTVWKDIQALGPVFDSAGRQLPALVTSNVGQALAKGAELEMTIVPTEKLLFNVNLGMLDTAYTNIVQTAFLLSTSSEFQGAPKNTGSLGVQYAASLKKGATLTTRVDYLYQSQFWRSLTFLRTAFWSAGGTVIPANFDESGGEGITNMRLTYEPGGDANWNLAFFGTNLSNTQLLNSGFFHGIWAFDFATVGRPRELGVQMNFKLK